MRPFGEPRVRLKLPLCGRWFHASCWIVPAVRVKGICEIGSARVPSLPLHSCRRSHIRATHELETNHQHMLFSVRFTDKPDSLELRGELLPAHLAWLATKDAILLAGALRPEPDGKPVGALWIVEAESRSAVESLYSTDPFWTGGLRASVEILHLTKALPERMATV